MEVLSHLFAELIKISILGSLYATLTVLLFRAIGKNNPNGWIYKIGKQTVVLWFLSGFIISIGLFFFMFSYWGDHGLGDGPKIPIGNGFVVENTNWDNDCYVTGIKSSDNYDIMIAKYIVEDEKLLGNFDFGFYDYKNSFFIYDLENREIMEFKTQEEFDDYVSKHNLPDSDELLCFRDSYNKYWGGWRFWLLP